MASESTGAVQEMFAKLTEKGVENIEAALLRIPEGKRSWSPEGKARTALDQVAEVALLNGNSATIITARAWPEDFNFDQYYQDKATIAASTEVALAKLKETLPLAVAAIRSLSDEDLKILVSMPWGPMTLGEILAYPHWNMSYHEGQINYIASMLGCLP